MEQISPALSLIAHTAAEFRSFPTVRVLQSTELTRVAIPESTFRAISPPGVGTSGAARVDLAPAHRSRRDVGVRPLSNSLPNSIDFCSTWPSGLARSTCCIILQLAKATALLVHLLILWLPISISWHSTQLHLWPVDCLLAKDHDCTLRHSVALSTTKRQRHPNLALQYRCCVQAQLC